MTETVLVSHFKAKPRQVRRQASDLSGKGFTAQEIATQVLRLCYPIREIAAVHVYRNSSPVEPFLLAEHPDLGAGDDRSIRMRTPITEFMVVDVYFLFDDAQSNKTEEEAFVVEVTFPLEADRIRWEALARVRWVDLGWKSEDSLVPQLCGETYVCAWM